MRVLDKRETLNRREFLAGSGGALGASLVIAGGAVVAPSQGWAVEVKALKPETMAALIQMARDVYPHDRLADRYYAAAVKAHDETAAEDEGHKTLIEDGIADLNERAAAAGSDSGYLGLGWEAERVALLRQIADTAFFQAVRGGLVVGLYNNKEVWPLFGYEGASADQGGYIERGFDDIDWL